RRRHTRFSRDWSSDVCSSDLDLAGERRAHGAPRYISSFCDFLGGASRIGMDNGQEASTAQEVAALGERLNVTVNLFQIFKARTRHRKQLVLHLLKMLADDVQARIR